MLDYIALGILIFAAITLFYGIIVIHDIPYEIAVHRNHPHQDAIHYAGWVSLFTLHAIWPFLWIWSTLYREDRGWGFQEGGPPLDESPPPDSADEAPTTEPVPDATASAATEEIASQVTLIQHRIDTLDERIERIEQAILAASNDADGAS